jgi:hypothetical protein
MRTRPVEPLAPAVNCSGVTVGDVQPVTPVQSRSIAYVAFAFPVFRTVKRWVLDAEAIAGSDRAVGVMYGRYVGGIEVTVSAPLSDTVASDAYFATTFAAAVPPTVALAV